MLSPVGNYCPGLGDTVQAQSDQRKQVEHAAVGISWAFTVVFSGLVAEMGATTLLRDQFLLSHVIRDPQSVDQRLSAA